MEREKGRTYVHTTCVRHWKRKGSLSVPLPCKCWQKPLFIAACKLGSGTNQNQAQKERASTGVECCALYCARRPFSLCWLARSLSLSQYINGCVCVCLVGTEKVIYGHCYVLGCELELFGESVSTGGEFRSDGSRDMSFKGAPPAQRILSDLLPPK